MLGQNKKGKVEEEKERKKDKNNYFFSTESLQTVRTYCSPACPLVPPVSQQVVDHVVVATAGPRLSSVHLQRVLRVLRMLRHGDGDGDVITGAVLRDVGSQFLGALVLVHKQGLQL